MPKKKTHEEYLQELQNRGIKVRPLEEYRGNSTKIKHQCICGNEWEVRPTTLLMRKSTCGCRQIENTQRLNRSKRKTHEQYLQELDEKGIKVKPLEQYKNKRIKITHQCECGNEWLTTPEHVLRGCKCGCGIKTSEKFQEYLKRQTQTHEQYLQKLKEINHKVIPIEKYVNRTTKILHQCECGNTWKASPKVILEGCFCGCKAEKNHEQYLQLLKEKNINITPLEPYQKMTKKINHKCNCGTVWRVEPHSVLKGIQCGCIKSKYELIIQQYLKEENIQFETQATFSDLKGTSRLLRYDFSIYKKGKLICLIEYHGEQHFKFIKHWHKTKEYFNTCQRRDKKKRDYAAKKGIPLIEILYNDTDPIRTLEKELKALGIMEPQKRKYEQMSLF